MSNKKPTMMQVKNVINNILRQMSVVSTKLDQVDGIVNMYISFKKDRDSFKKYVDEQLKEKMKEQSNGSISGSTESNKDSQSTEHRTAGTE